MVIPAAVGALLILFGIALLIVDLGVTNHGLPVAVGVVMMLAGGSALLWAGGKERGVAIRRKISLRSHEESIRLWASEGKDDAWIAHALGTSPASIQSFR
ncbi:MAG: hypothetical protein M3N33_02070, partial [Actinomycetota bacterium]|nr:hypothetical protein [Actinomycetota bacterium]